MKFEKIFKPIRIGNLEIKNRTIFPPISTNFADKQGRLTEKFINHYVRRAKGEMGLIIIENVTIDYPEGKKGAFSPRFDSEEFLDDWKRLTAVIHQYDCKISVELTHPGFKGKGIGVDDLPEKKILNLIDIYAKAALLAKNAGFDMVEIQGAHGLLVNQFLSPLTNHRIDKWGENRALFAVEIRKKIKELCGLDFPVTIRLAVRDTKEGGITIEEGKYIASVLSENGYNMIQADIGIGPKEFRLEPISFPEAWRAYLAKKIQPQPIPIAAVGMIRSPETAEKLLQDGIDMVVLGRTLLADPDWVKKVRENKIHLIRKCIGCSECIRARHDEDVAIWCGVNPNVGNEVEVIRSQKKKRIAVIGCGPAGLEATRILAIRGIDVHLFCDKFGGQLKAASVPPGKDKIHWLVDYYKNTLETLPSVTMHPKADSEEDVLNVNPDAVILATGVKPITPFDTTPDYVHTYDEILERTVVLKEKNIIVCGGGLIGAETALYLSRDNSVTIVEMLDDIAIGMETLSRKVLLKELNENNVKVLTKHKVERIEPYILLTTDLTNNRTVELPFDDVVFAFGNKPYSPFHFKDIPVYKIGDAKKVRRIADAVREGFRIGMSL